MRKATAGWGRKKTRQYVLKVIRPLRGEAMRGKTDAARRKAYLPV
jgi:hypothetical protein